MAPKIQRAHSAECDTSVAREKRGHQYLRIKRYYLTSVVGFTVSVSSAMLEIVFN